jgi:hypothetical protein
MPDESTGQTGDPGKISEGGGQPQEQPQNRPQVQALEPWYEDQSPDVIGLINDKLGGLRNALETIKKERNDLRTTLQTKDLDNDAKITQLTEQLEHAEQRAAFMESLPPNVVDKELAFLAATKAGLVNRDGSAKVEDLQSLHPGLFSSPSVPPGRAGAGTDTPPKPQKLGINDAFRIAAGGQL